MEKFKQLTLYNAIKDLNALIDKDDSIPPFTLNVCGGFALLLHNVRKEDMITDVDYIGSNLDIKVTDAVHKIAEKYGFDRDWVNNDVLLADSTREELEFTTGKLHFEPKISFSKIKVNALIKEDILRMKMIAIDTQVSGLMFGGDFTRIKDIKDIRLLMEDLGYTMNDVRSKCNGYILIEGVYDLVEEYLYEDKISPKEFKTKAQKISEMDEFGNDDFSDILSEYGIC